MEIRNSEERPCYSNWQVMKSPEIVEIDDNSKCCVGSTDEGIADVFVAVGKNDMDVLKWALNHAVLPGNRILLVHVSSPIAYIPTPVGMLSIGQLSRRQMQIYINEENTKRRNLLQKYISLCTDAKVLVDTMLVESDKVAKTIVDLIPVVNITNLVMGTRRPPSTSMFKTGVGKAAYVQKNAPRYCDISIVCLDKKKQRSAQQPEINFRKIVCFSGKFK
ncbi:U-box domain-containing protein 52-like [Heracleum sosnowskyi]|uniref:U-box domain-containing protein 52-like n=1 Tax=Heracleum sosnowskyi TaxID=360622 RepID=A0AAD8MJ10_9APIA|nr:U-box domain-containing protein 52-like [Heracleum sosnowskyi]